MAGLFITSPQSLFPVIKSSLGKTILLLALILQTTGGVIIIKMVSKEII
jgi:Flp pilus assembly protein TadB